jgi:hypothetical protein
LRATWEHIYKETKCISVFDGDDAGRLEIRNLQAYFGAKEIPFQANLHFVSLRKDMSVEGMFSDDWIKELHERSSHWFETYSIDTA